MTGKNGVASLLAREPRLVQYAVLAHDAECAFWMVYDPSQCSCGLSDLLLALEETKDAVTPEVAHGA